MDANRKLFREVNIDYKQEHSMSDTPPSQGFVSGRHPHVPMCIRGLDIRNVPNPWPICGESTPHLSGYRLTAKHLVLRSPSCEEYFLNQPLMISPADTMASVEVHVRTEG